MSALPLSVLTMELTCREAIFWSQIDFNPLPDKKYLESISFPDCFLRDRTSFYVIVFIFK